MSANLSRSRSSVEYQRAPVTRGPWERELVAQGFSSTEGGAYQRLLRMFADVERVAHAARRAGATERMMGHLLRVQRALLAEMPTVATLDRPENVADGEEDTLWSEYLHTRTPETRARWLREARRHVALLTLKIHAVEAES